MRRPLLAPLVAVLVCTAAAASAQTPVHDPLDDATVRFGSFGITPTIQLTNIGTDNNVFNDATDPKQDFTFTLTPKADVLFRPSFMHVTYTTATDYVYYRTYASQRGVDESSSVRVEVPVWHVQPFVGLSGISSHERLNEEIDVRARHHTRTVDAGVQLAIATRTSITVAVHRSDFTYTEGTFRGADLAQALDNRNDSADATIGFALTPITSFAVVGSVERQSFDVAHERDQRTIRVTPTFTFVPGGLLSGSIAVGYRRLHALAPTVPDFTGLVATGSIGLALGRSQIQTILSRDLRNSYDRETPYYLATGATVTLTTVLFGPVDLRLIGGRESMDYRYDRAAVTAPPPSAHDAFYRYGAGLGWRIRRRFRIGVNGEWTSRRSDLDASRQYDNHSLFGTFTWGTTQ